jgi:hypothetical protein
MDFEVEWYVKLVTEVNFMASFIVKVFEVSVLLGYDAISFFLDL